MKFLDQWNAQTDNIAELEESEEALEEANNMLNQMLNEYNMKIKKTKTKVMVW